MGLLASPWFWLAAIVALAGAFAAGVKVESDHRDAQLLVQERAAAAAFRNEVKRGAAITAGLVKDKQRLATTAAELREELRNAKPSDLATCSPAESPAAAGTGAAPDPGVRLLPEFIRMWNDRLFVRTNAGGTTGSPTGSGSVSPTDVLANLGENGERWAECRAQLRKVIEFEAGRAR